MVKEIVQFWRRCSILPKQVSWHLEETCKVPNYIYEKGQKHPIACNPLIHPTIKEHMIDIASVILLKLCSDVVLEKKRNATKIPIDRVWTLELSTSSWAPRGSHHDYRSHDDTSACVSLIVNMMHCCNCLYVGEIGQPGKTALKKC